MICQWWFGFGLCLRWMYNILVYNTGWRAIRTHQCFRHRNYLRCSNQRTLACLIVYEKMLSELLLLKSCLNPLIPILNGNLNGPFITGITVRILLDSDDNFGEGELKIVGSRLWTMMLLLLVFTFSINDDDIWIRVFVSLFIDVDVIPWKLLDIESGDPELALPKRETKTRKWLQLWNTAEYENKNLTFEHCFWTLTHILAIVFDSMYHGVYSLMANYWPKNLNFLHFSQRTFKRIISFRKFGIRIQTYRKSLL